MLRKFILALIKIYQKTISPDHGYFPILKLLGECRHYPTCSQYTYQAIKREGALKGLWLGLKRLATCHPWGS
ncbi:MAG: membrane protein insertion efficiency factor YidD [Candidatus Omnitrophica bacterium CG02_land_8_20_14_3_00__42_8]|uniref:Membrane protein insertion efficiency factor YidD n=1 Tax=Candidatus Portnoybacteria bacterium CG03_land_8_20_14_0_80_41_10 TaxID=1974808 RepID=A0A2M7BU40_9BACT|nr:MAG: membrane protein insertion efficiency factor YidD [Candidatus Portnoybacteria bacterium CG03_land_8_20_14_0_80_41_10]PIV39862.1 MAG: membrane protein insertion efficiency factor YidD [Candidatus Omnitrophica bacterium CG02_land_8_20_14_3_00__42_8]